MHWHWVGSSGVIIELAKIAHAAKQLKLSRLSHGESRLKAAGHLHENGGSVIRFGSGVRMRTTPSSCFSLLSLMYSRACSMLCLLLCKRATRSYVNRDAGQVDPLVAKPWKGKKEGWWCLTFETLVIFAESDRGCWRKLVIFYWWWMRAFMWW